MRTDRYTVTTTTADTTVSLTALSPGDSSAAGLVNQMADFDVEVVGNDAAVTMTGKGTFASSAHFSITDGSFAIGGGKKSIQGFALSELKFSRVGTTSYSINITRRVP